MPPRNSKGEPSPSRPKANTKVKLSKTVINNSRALCEAHNDETLLIRLPQDIRERIWNLALPSGDIFAANYWPAAADLIDSKVLASHNIHDTKAITELPPLLQVSHQIRHEATQQFYASKLILLGIDSRDENLSCMSMTITEKYLQSLSLHAIENMRRIAVLEYDYNLRTWRKILFHLKTRKVEALLPKPVERGDGRQLEKEVEILKRMDFFHYQPKMNKKVTRAALIRVLEACASWGGVLGKEHRLYLGDEKFLPKREGR